MSLDTLEIFFGDANPAQARVYVRSRDAGSHLDGYLIGPECTFAKTLPARIPFVNSTTSQAEGRESVQHSGSLAEAIIPDPCFWTPELPFLYRAHLQSNGHRIERAIGIRRLAARDGHLHFDGKRFVLRAVRIQIVETALEYAHETWTALVVENPSDELCQHASRRGVLLIADLTAQRDPEICRLAQWPAVGIALLNSAADLPRDIRGRIPNLLLAQHIPGAERTELAPWAQLAFVEFGAASKFAQLAIPIIAVRQLPDSTSIEQSRAACDALQRELASQGDFAGYAV